MGFMELMIVLTVRITRMAKETGSTFSDKRLFRHKNKYYVKIGKEENNMREYEVTLGFCGYIGVSETYTVYADNEEQAREYALEMAMEDLSVDEIIEIEEVELPEEEEE